MNESTVLWVNVFYLGRGAPQEKLKTQFDETFGHISVPMSPEMVTLKTRKPFAPVHHSSNVFGAFGAQ